MQTWPIRQKTDPSHQKTSRAYTKRQNIRNVLDLVAARGTTSRAEIARVTGLTRATVSTIVKQLVEQGLVMEVGKGHSDGGKPPTLLQLAPDGRLVVSIDLSVDPFMGAIVNLGGRPTSQPTEADMSGDHQHDVNQLVSRLLSIANQPPIGITIASPGVIGEDGVVVEAPNLGWRHHRLAALTSAASGLPATVVNGARAATVAAYSRLIPTDTGAASGQSEVYRGGVAHGNGAAHTNGAAHGNAATHDEAESPTIDGHAQPSGMILILSSGDGVGAGVILDGRIHAGNHNAAGEIGHTVLDPNGEKCRCGNRGCLETVASASAIYASMAGERPEPGEWDLRQAQDAFGTEAVDRALTAAGTALGTTTSFLVNALDVSQVAITMQPKGVAKRVAEIIDEVLTPRVLPSLRPDLVVSAIDGEDLALVGAARLFLYDQYGLSWQRPTVHAA